MALAILFIMAEGFYRVFHSDGVNVYRTYVNRGCDFNLLFPC